MGVDPRQKSESIELIVQKTYKAREVFPFTQN